MTLFWHCIFPGDISPKPRRQEIYAYSDCGEGNDGFRSVVLWLWGPESPIPLYVQYVTPPTLTTSPSLRVSMRSLSLPETRAIWCSEMCQQVSMCWQGHAAEYSACMWSAWFRHTNATKCMMILKLIIFLLPLWNSFELICARRSSFLIRFDFVTSNPGRWIIPSAARRSEFHFTSHHAFTVIFTHKTTQICNSSICTSSIWAWALVPICCAVISATAWW